MVTEPLAGWREVTVEVGQDRLVWARTVGRLAEEVYAPERARSMLRRLEIVHTPVHGSWLNVAEVERSVLARQALNRRIGSREELEAVVCAWASTRTAEQKGVDWQFTTEDARGKLARLYPTVSA